MNILDKIVQTKIKEVEHLKSLLSIEELELNIETAPNFSFVETLDRSDRIEIIAEIKKGSPSKGYFAPGLDIKATAEAYQAHGAGAISVLTDGPYFYGSFENLSITRNSVNLPILCKEFIIDEIQIAYARSLGANLILLIASIHSQERLEELISYAHRVGLEVLMEIHTYEEYQKVNTLKFDILGINNRDLKTFTTDIQHTCRMLKKIKNRRFHVISESGIHSESDALILANQGVSGLLIGESLIKSDRKSSLLQEFRKRKESV